VVAFHLHQTNLASSDNLTPDYMGEAIQFRSLNRQIWGWSGRPRQAEGQSPVLLEKLKGLWKKSERKVLTVARFPCKKRVVSHLQPKSI
jgi:hypothetical protein